MLVLFMILFIISFVISYLTIAFVFGYKYPEIQSIIHCVISTLWHAIILFGFTSISFFSWTAGKDLNTYVYENPYLKSYLTMVITHSIGYFIADTIFILSDRKNTKMRQYILHHIIAIVMISPVYFDSYIANYGLFCAELGGVVHHLKTRYNNIYTFILYVLIYTLSRVLMLINIFYYTLHIDKYTDIVTIILNYPLLYQNTIWLGINIKNYFK